MRVAIAGAGAVGRSIASELVEYGHDVILIERDPTKVEPSQVPQAEWVNAGRGLRIVRSLAHERGVTDERNGRTVWASLGGPSRRRA